MYLLVALAILGTAMGVPVEPQTRNLTRNTLAEQYVLPDDTFPTFYDVQFFFDPDNEANFTGAVSIRIFAIKPVSEIVLHAMAMQINSIQIFTDLDAETNLYYSFSLTNDETHRLTIETAEPLIPLRPYIIKIEYTAYFAANMFGVYLSKYEENGVSRSLITSQLQPTFARRAFPCYDEPDKKAIFRTTIYAPAAYSVIRSNTVIRSDPLKEEITGWVKHEFEDTLVMSTYLLAYLVSNFYYISNEQNPIYHLPFRVYSRPGTQDQAEFALEFGQQNLAALEDYTQFAYEFPKMDKVAVPDFAAGAMENWGLVIYREVALLVQDGVTTTSVRQNIGRIICHENVHQWFGNEVSPVSWTYTWLNEGFANFFENFATDMVLPDWRMMDQFVIALQNVFQSDAVLSVNPMTHAVYTPSEILGTFNAVAYQKSGSVIRMIQHFLTPAVFRQGLVNYIEANSRKAATPAELYSALQAALDASSHSIPWPVATILNRWTNQGGFPVITVRRTAPAANSLYIAQERYLTDTSLSSSDRWHIPVNWVLSTDVNFTDTSPQMWVGVGITATAVDIPGLPEAEWFIVNKQQTGYYRVNYDSENWQALAGVLVANHELIHVLNRAQILDDSFNLARTGRLAYDLPFDISLFLEKEEDYIPWAAANPAFSYLDLALSGLSAHELFAKYLLSLSAPLFTKLGFDAAANEEHVTPYHRNIILDINCRLGNQECINQAQQKLEEFRNNPTQALNPDIQTTVFCSGLRGGDEENFNFLWGRYLATSDSSEQSILLSSLGCNTNADRRTFYLDQVINDDSPVREQDKHTIIVSVINSSPENMEAALDFCHNHWHNIQPRVQGLTGTTNILNAFARRLTTQEHSDKINAFETQHQGIFTAGELASIAAIKENIAASITWSNENVLAVESWLEKYFNDENNGGDSGEDSSEESAEDSSEESAEDSSEDNDGNSATGLTAGLVVLMSFLVSIVNY